MVKWSFSGLKDFVNCPRQYNEVKVKQNYTKGVTEQMRYGTDVHKALEEYVRDGTPLPDFYTRFRKTVDALKSIPGEPYVEYKMALREDKSPCDFSAGNYWVRGIVDLMIIDGDTAFVTDYKTGSAKYPDSKQLMLTQHPAPRWQPSSPALRQKSRPKSCPTSQALNLQLQPPMR